VTAALAELQGAIPAGAAVDRIVFRQADFIAVALRNVGRALAESSLVVAVVLFVFFGRWRATAISLVAIPISLLAAVIAFRLLGLSINTMTLGGFAIAIGELVDDAVVDVENVFRRLRENAASGSPRRALAVVADASVEVRSGILTATVIIVLMLAPLLLLSGVEGCCCGRSRSPTWSRWWRASRPPCTVTPVLCARCRPGARRAARGGPLARPASGSRGSPWSRARCGWRGRACRRARALVAVGGRRAASRCRAR
jgi:HME family heavy-metal exporter